MENETAGRKRQTRLTNTTIMLQYEIITRNNLSDSTFGREALADFLYEHLDQYGDRREDILRCIDFAIGDDPCKNGFVVAGHDGNEIAGVVVINETGMKGYIPANLLVYIAVNSRFRGQGVGKELMQRTIDHADGDIALHVEPDNPARHLYEKMGFTNKYLEMRLVR